MIKKIFKLMCFFAVLILYFLLTLIAYPFRSKKFQNMIMRDFSEITLRILNIKVDYGLWKVVYPKKTIIVCNHVSYLDIPILLSYFGGGRFIVAEGIRKWPVIGWTIAMLGHTFIERGNKKSYEKINNAVKKDNIIIFPEGRTSLGETIREFKNGAFVAAIKNKAFILPIVIKYSNKEAAWYGDMSLIPHVWRICEQKIEAHLYICEIIDSSIKNLKEYTRKKMLEMINPCV